MGSLLAESVTPLLWLLADDPVPEAEDVTAGWVAALVFVFLILAGVFLARSFLKQLRKAQAAREAGVYGDPPATPTQTPTQQRPDAASQ